MSIDSSSTHYPLPTTYLVSADGLVELVVQGSQTHRRGVLLLALIVDVGIVIERRKGIEIILLAGVGTVLSSHCVGVKTLYGKVWLGVI